MADMKFTPTLDDWQRLLNENQTAAAQLRAIILERLLVEKEAELVTLQKTVTQPENVTDIDVASKG
jgi:hypothetical protein